MSDNAPSTPSRLRRLSHESEVQSSPEMAGESISPRGEDGGLYRAERGVLWEDEDPCSWPMDTWGETDDSSGSEDGPPGGGYDGIVWEEFTRDSRGSPRHFREIPSWYIEPAVHTESQARDEASDGSGVALGCNSDGENSASMGALSRTLSLGRPVVVRRVSGGADNPVGRLLRGDQALRSSESSGALSSPGPCEGWVCGSPVGSGDNNIQRPLAQVVPGVSESRHAGTEERSAREVHVGNPLPGCQEEHG